MHAPSYHLGAWRKARGLSAHVPLAETVCPESYAQGFADAVVVVSGGRGGRFETRGARKPGRR